MNNIDMLKCLCGTKEFIDNKMSEVSFIESIFSSYTDTQVRINDNIYMKKNGKGKGNLIIAAHYDEVSLIVTEILQNGFIRFKTKGIDPKILASQEVIVHGRTKVAGIIGIKPLILMNSDEISKSVSVDNLFIDTGLEGEHLNKLIRIGDIVTLKGKFIELLNNNVSCKSLDNRSGVLAMYLCAKEICSLHYDFDIYFVAFWGKITEQKIKDIMNDNSNSTIGIVIDTTFDSGNLGAKDRENNLGQGPVICIGPNIDSGIRKKLIDTAKKEFIPYQIEVEPWNTKTEAWNMQIANGGIPSALVSIPLKYMHTSVEMVNMKDIENTSKLLISFVNNFKFEELETYYALR